MSLVISKDDKKYFSIALIISLLFIYPLINYGIYFRDDLDRSVTGYYGWSVLGRPLADLVSQLASASAGKLLDIFPYSLIASGIFIAASSLLIKKFLDTYEVKNSGFSAALLVFNPFMLQNLAYKFDSLSMSLSLLFCIASYTYLSNNRKLTVAVRIALGVAALSLYQPCVNIYLGIMAIESAVLFTKHNVNIKSFIKIMLSRASIFLVFYITYFLTIARVWGGANKRSQTVSFDMEGLNVALLTFRKLNGLVGEFIYGNVFYYFIIPTILTLLVAITICIKSSAGLLTKVVSFISTLLLMYISLIGPMFLLREAPVYSRILVSFSCFFIIMGVILSSKIPRLRFFLFLPVVTVMAFSAQFANAIKDQRDHEDYVLNMVSYDLLNTPDIKQIKTFGSINFSKRAELLAKEKPLINQSISRASEFLATFQLQNKGLIGVSEGYGIEKKNGLMLDKFIHEGVTPIKSNSEYSIYVKNGIAIVVFGKGR